MFLPHVTSEYLAKTELINLFPGIFFLLFFYLLSNSSYAERYKAQESLATVFPLWRENQKETRERKRGGGKLSPQTEQ